MLEPKLFNAESDFDKQAREILKPISKLLDEDSTNFMIDCTNCYDFADIIINKGLILFTNVIPTILYREIMNNIIDEFNDVGSYKAYYFLMKLFFGNSSTITFETIAPAHLKINVANIDIRTYDWIDSSGEKMFDYTPVEFDEEPTQNQIIFADKILELTEDNLKKLIENIKPVGFIVDINIVS